MAKSARPRQWQSDASAKVVFFRFCLCVSVTLVSYRIGLSRYNFTSPPGCVKHFLAPPGILCALACYTAPWAPIIPQCQTDVKHFRPRAGILCALVCYTAPLGADYTVRKRLCQAFFSPSGQIVCASLLGRAWPLSHPGIIQQKGCHVKQFIAKGPF